MVDETTTTAPSTTDATTAAPKRAAVKRKAAPKAAATRKAPGRPRAASKSAGVKTAEKVEAKTRTYKRRTTKVTKEADETAARLGERARIVSRNAFLASLGFYGKAFDTTRGTLDKLASHLEERGKSAETAYNELVARGTEVEKSAKNTLSDLELPKLKLRSLKDRTELETRIKHVRERLAALRESLSFSSAA